MSRHLLEDMEQIASDRNIPWGKMKDSTTLITGATGTLGAALIRGLYAANSRYGLGVRILAFGRDCKKAEPLIKNYDVEYFQQDIREPLMIDGAVNFIFHCAAVTKSFDMATDPVGVAETSIHGTSNVLTLAREKHIASMVYLSSMEVYGDTDPALLFLTEDDLGMINLKDPRSCYPESKRMSECLCNCSVAQYGTPVKTARLAQTFGAGTSVDDPRVFAQFARSAIAGENIVLHTEGRSHGNYCYLSDTVRGLFTLLLKGGNGETYNIANPKASMTIRQMAELVANQVCGGKISVVVDKPTDIKALGYAPDATGRLSSDKIEKLGWKPEYKLADMYRRMIDDWHTNNWHVNKGFNGVLANAETSTKAASGTY